MPDNAKYWKHVERSRRRFIGKFTRKLTRDMRAIVDPIIAMLEYSPTIDHLQQMTELIRTDHINGTLVEMYGAVGSYFGLRIDKQVKKSASDVKVAICKSSAEEEVWREWLEQFAMQRAGIKFMSINKTVRKEMSAMINQMINEGRQAGLGIEEIARKLKKDLPKGWGLRSMSHARTIAQTEITTASNVVSHNAMEQMGYGYKKTWVTSPMGIIKTERHTLPSAIAEFTVDRSEKYMVDGGSGYEPMDHPGDLNASAENTINCHCCEVYEII